MPEPTGAEPVDPDDDSLDRAFRAALAESPERDAPEHARRRRETVLAAALAAVPVAAEAAPQPVKAANDPRWQASAAAWRGLAAACVLVASSLVVTRLLDEGAGQPGFDSPTLAAASPASSPSPAPPAPPPPARTELQASRMQDLPAQRRAGAHPAAPSSPARPAGSAPVGSAAATAPPPEASTTLPAAPQAAAESTRPAAGLSGTPQPADTATTEAGLPAERSLRDNAAAARQRADGLALTHNKAAEAADTPRQAALAKALTGRPRPVPGNSLLAAVVRGDIESARQWLAAAGPDAGQDGDGRSALALAVLRADLAMVRLLLAHGADRLARDRFGQTPQGYAAAQADPALRTAFDLP